MNLACRAVGVIAVVLATASASRAQDAPSQAASPAKIDVHGSADVGYRFTSIDGSIDTYRQLFDLSDGVRLMGLDVHGQATDGAHAFADSFSLSASGIGGDPFPAVQFTARKARRYDLRVNWRKSWFNDMWPATPTSIAGLDTQAVTDHHAWTTSRQIGNVGLVVNATNRLHVLFNFSRVAREGVLQSTRAIDFVGSPSVWGAFARANPYPVVTPVDDSANRVTGGVSYSGDSWTVQYQTGYQTYNEQETFIPVTTPERSINVADPTTRTELLSALHIAQSRRLTSPLSELSYVVRPSPKVDWRGEYLFYRYRGPFSLNATDQGVARANSGGTTFSPYNVTVTASGEASAPNHVVGQSITYRFTDRWSADAQYRYSRFATDASGQLGSLLRSYSAGGAPAAAASESDEMSWRQTAHSLVLTTTFEPIAALTIRPGVRLLRRDVERRENGVIDPGTSERMNSIWPELTVGFRPSAQFSARGSYQTSYSDATYTRLSPAQRSVGNIIVRVEPIEGFTVDASVSRTDAELFAASFVSHTRLGGLHASYSFGEHLTATGGLDYQSFLGLGSVSFVRGTAPIADDQMRDRETDRIWQGGVIFKPASRVGIVATGNFLQTRGTDTIAGEPPLYGPVSFPYGTGSIYYDVPRAGRVTLDVQRTHMFQDLLPLNDFRATLVTIRYSRGF